MHLKKYYYILSLFIFCAALAPADDSQRPWVAVHDFTVSDELQEKGINGWRVAEQLEGDLAQKGEYRIVTRAKIAKVLKEKNITASSNLDTSSMVDMIGADFIITGSINSDNYKITLSAKLIDVKKQSGEIEKSYDLSVTGDTLEEAIKKLPSLYDEMSRKMTLSSGGLLDESLNYFESHNYTMAAKDFRELKKQLPIERIKALLAKNRDVPPTNNPTLVTPGELTDYGLEMMAKGKESEAASAFNKIMNFKNVKSIIEIDALITKAEEEGIKQREGIQKAIETASNLVRESKERNSSKDPATLLDEASSLLENILYNPNLPLNPEEKTKIEALLSNIKDVRKGIYQGPATGKEFLIPEIDIALLPIPKGSFTMGTDSAQPGTEKPDNPAHNVTISKPFWMAKCETSIAQFLFFLNDIKGNPSVLKIVNQNINWTSDSTPVDKGFDMKNGMGPTWGDKNQPIVGISWIAAREFCKWLTANEKKAKRIPKGYEYRLPTEAEWEYACRAGSSENSAATVKPDDSSLDQYALYRGNSDSKTANIGTRKPNAWGLHDILGNAWEWCNDWYDGPYIAEDATDPLGPSDSKENLKVARGGSFSSELSEVKPYTRYPVPYKSGKKNIGFRIVLAPEI